MDGKPLGLLMAWLIGETPCGSHEEHINIYLLNSLEYRRRLRGRDRLKTIPGGSELMKHEVNLPDGSDFGVEPVELRF